MRVTLKEVASRAELSISTTSRALNGHPAISLETRAKVRQIAGELRYRPVRTHRRAALVPSGILTGRQVAIISLGLDRSLVTMPVISEAFHGAELALREAGAKLQFAQMIELSKLPKELRPDELDGLILTGAMVREFEAAANTPAMNQLRKVPTVWVIGEPPGAWGDSIVADDFAVGYGAAEQLARYGHRHLAFLNPVPGNLLFARREDGFHAAARRWGVEAQSFCHSSEVASQLPLQAPNSRFDMVQTLIDEMLQVTPRITAVFTAADSVAALAYCALGMRGMRVGHEISIISGNNTPGLMSVPYPHLATFDIHSHKIGTLAVRQLALQLAERNYSSYVPRQVVVKPTFIPGESIFDIKIRSNSLSNNLKTRRNA